MKVISVLVCAILTHSLMAQQGTSKASKKDYYYQIPDYPDEYSRGTVAARVVDGLGFRFYWASEGLRQEDLDYRNVESARTNGETIDHIFGLSQTIINSVKVEPNMSKDWSHLSIDQKRTMALKNMQEASELLKSSKPSDMDGYRVIFKSKESTTEFPFWNMLNGPISDAIWHTGQVVSLRRASGNPIDPKISVLSGKRRD